MSRSQWQEHESMKSTKLRPSDLARQKKAMDVHDKSVAKFKRNERLAMAMYWACWLGVGTFGVYVVWKGGA